MSDPQTQHDVVEQLARIQETVTKDIARLSDEQFCNGTTEAWSAADYLKHLLLSVKPVAKAMGFPAEVLEKQFDLSGRASRTYAEVVKAYQKRLDEGIRAEDFDKVVPVFYRFPEGITDERAYLVQSWNESNQRLIAAALKWSEAELDSLQMPHPAVGMLTLREMLFFTIFHNTLHWHDIQHAGGL
ncbi:MAG: DinB family protein [Chloroflexota bacterium]